MKDWAAPASPRSCGHGGGVRDIRREGLGTVEEGWGHEGGGVVRNALEPEEKERERGKGHCVRRTSGEGHDEGNKKMKKRIPENANEGERRGVGKITVRETWRETETHTERDRE